MNDRERLDRAVDKLRDEMAKTKSRYVQVVGDYMTDYLQRHPEDAERVLAKGKSIQGSLNAMRAEARKPEYRGCIDDAAGFRVVLAYFGIKAEEAARPPEPDPFDLDTLLGGALG